MVGDEGLSGGTMRSSLETRIGLTFVLLMQVRVLVVGVTVLINSEVRGNFKGLWVLALAALVSGVALMGWERLVPRLFDQPALLAFDVLIGYAVLAVGGIIGPYFLVTIVAAGLAGLLYRWPAVLLLCAQQTVLYYVALGQQEEKDIRDAVGLPLLLAMPSFYIIAALVGGVLRRLYDEQAEAEEARWQSEALALAAAERSRLAREMHDSLTGTLSGIALASTGLPAWIRKSPERAEAEAQRIAAAAQVAARQARELIAELREDAVQHPLGVAIDEIAAEWERTTGIPVRTRVQDGVDLPLSARHETLAIVKEALENVSRHAEASRVEISVAGDRDLLEVCVRDDGHGLSVRPGGEGWLDALSGAGHYGLLGMHERARRAGGELVVDSLPGAGTGITVRFAGEDAAGGRAALTRRRDR
ncbi:sensor histidine kinase [Actinomadura rudentiformis]|uniref:sensor histidine kinase n=1 Tax=Actinomadura rudentiformis TaxID=359158 RepID=UPI00178C775D|nr:histidine kinase [Actinomadura rudentiformis]